MSASATLIVTATPNPSEPAAMRAYLQGVMPLLMGAGGQLVKRLGVGRTFAGDPGYEMVLVMDFPSPQAVDDLFSSDAYQALVPVRDRGFTRMEISVARSL